MEGKTAMTKDEKNTLLQEGNVILRTQFDHRKELWKIVKATRSGGWARFGGGWYATRNITERKIRVICDSYPKHIMET
jgi:hypothetical protein